MIQVGGDVCSCMFMYVRFVCIVLWWCSGEWYIIWQIWQSNRTKPCITQIIPIFIKLCPSAGQTQQKHQTMTIECTIFLQEKKSIIWGQAFLGHLDPQRSNKKKSNCKMSSDLQDSVDQLKPSQSDRVWFVVIWSLIRTDQLISWCCELFKLHSQFKHRITRAKPKTSKPSDWRCPSAWYSKQQAYPP